MAVGCGLQVNQGMKRVKVCVVWACMGGTLWLHVAGQSNKG